MFPWLKKGDRKKENIIEVALYVIGTLKVFVCTFRKSTAFGGDEINETICYHYEVFFSFVEVSLN